MIRIVEYGVGNIQAFLNVFKRLGIAAERARSADELGDASRLILPGVGAFDHAMSLLNASGMRDTLERRVLGDGIPVLGVCVGMQMLASRSDEGVLPGLNWIPGHVRAFASVPEARNLPMPHMGWNSISAVPDSLLFTDFEPLPRFYFLHSYYFQCEDQAHAVAKTSYGLDFACAVSRGSIHGAQFHPEKSHHSGAQLLKNFAGCS